MSPEFSRRMGLVMQAPVQMMSSGLRRELRTEIYTVEEFSELPRKYRSLIQRVERELRVLRGWG